MSHGYGSVSNQESHIGEKFHMSATQIEGNQKAERGGDRGSDSFNLSPW